MKKKIKLYKSLLVEIIETLCTICLVLERLCYRNHIDDGIHMRGHIMQLKKYSEDLRQNS